MKRLFYTLEHSWRQLMTIVCFSLFGLGGLVLSFIGFHCLLICCRDTHQRARIARRSVCASFRLFLLTAKIVGVLNYRFEGLKKLRNDKGCLILANHPTLLDYVLIASVIPEVDCLVKSALLRNPCVSKVIRASHYLINNQHDQLLTECKTRLQRGDNVLIFPEGTRTVPGLTSHFQRGAANIALRCQCPIRLIHIHSSETALNKQRKWYRIPKKKLFLTVTIGERFIVDELIDPSLDLTSIKARRLTQKLETLLT